MYGTVLSSTPLMCRFQILTQPNITLLDLKYTTRIVGCHALCIWISMTPFKDPKGLSQGKPWRGRFSDLVIYDVLYHISTFVHKCVLDLPITSGKFRRSLYCSIMIVDLLQANEDIQTWIMLCAAKLVMLVWKLTSTFSHETLPSPVTIFSTMTAHAGN
jgi:hypothetical protein